MSEVQKDELVLPEQAPRALALIKDIQRKADSSYVVSCNGYPFHATASDTPDIYLQVIAEIEAGAAVTEYVEPEAVKPDPLSTAVAEYNRLRAQADFIIAPLQDALDIDEATSGDLAQLTAWKKYRVQLSRVSAQPDYPSSPVWPVVPK